MAKKKPRRNITALATEEGVMGNDTLPEVREAIRQTYVPGQERRVDRVGLFFCDRDVFAIIGGRPRLIAKGGSHLSAEESALANKALKEFEQLNNDVDEKREELGIKRRWKLPTRERARVILDVDKAQPDDD